MSKKFLNLCAIILASTLTVFAQGAVDGRGTQQPAAEGVAERKRLADLLRHPSFIALRLVSHGRDVPREKPSDSPAPYKVKDWIGFHLLVSQNLVADISVARYRNPYYEVRPVLMKEGEIVPYGEHAQRGVERAEATFPPASLLKLKPGTEYELQDVRIDDWYDPLNAGRYELTVRRRFDWKGDWLTSAPIYFEVRPRTFSAIPAGVSIEIVPEGFQPKIAVYEVTGDVTVIFFVVNNSDQPVKRNVIDREYGNQPQLFGDGALIPYRAEMEQRIRTKEENPRLIEITNDVFMEPKMRSWGHGISLKDWYGPLLPGSYRLTVRQRFEIDGPWTAYSAELVFEVKPE